MTDEDRQKFLQRVGRERAEQGLPEKITDPEVLQLVAAIVKGNRLPKVSR